MKRPHFSPTSRGDLNEIFDYIAGDNPRAAADFVSEAKQKCRMLAESPEIGTPRGELARSLRSYPLGSYIIFYRPVEDGIEVVRVLHGARDIPKLFR